MKRKKNSVLMDRKGLSNFVQIAIGFGVGVVGFVIVVILLNSLLTSSAAGNGMCNTAGYVYNITTGDCNQATNISNTQGASFAGNITNQGLVFSGNFASQWGLAGTILGYVLVLTILSLIGLGAYVGYQKVRGNR